MSNSSVSALPSPVATQKTGFAPIEPNTSTRPVSDLNAEKVVTTINVDDSLGQAEIWINGEPKGRTPYNLEGPHGQAFDIVIKKEGFEDFKLQGFTVSVGKNQYLISESMMKKKN